MLFLATLLMMRTAMRMTSKLLNNTHYFIKSLYLFFANVEVNIKSLTTPLA